MSIGWLNDVETIVFMDSEKVIKESIELALNIIKETGELWEINPGLNKSVIGKTYEIVPNKTSFCIIPRNSKEVLELMRGRWGKSPGAGIWIGKRFKIWYEKVDKWWILHLVLYTMNKEMPDKEFNGAITQMNNIAREIKEKLEGKAFIADFTYQCTDLDPEKLAEDTQKK